MTQAVVVMGVSGCGKSAVAAGMAQQLGWRAVDADDLHSPQAVAKMRAGQALNDDDRAPWLNRVGAVLAASSTAASTTASTTASKAADTANTGMLVACSALRRTYRDRLRAACPGLRFLFLEGERSVLAARMAQRPGHYMPASLLDSQLQTLERPGADEPDVLRLDIDQPLHTLVQQACTAVRQANWCAV